MSDRAVPNLPSRDLTVTAEFYGSFGFEESFRDASWLIVERGPVVLEFFPFPDLDPATSSFMCSVRVADLDGLHAAIAAVVPERDSSWPRLSPIALRPWGRRAGFLIDPDGTQLHLIEESAPPA
ncbi:MAG: bleomycin resistance protein [Microbacterium enclense]